MKEKKYDLIVIGCGSGGLSVGLFMAEVGLNVLMVSKSDRDIGGECLNDGCVPSKALIHVSRIVRQIKEAEHFGIQVHGTPDIQKVMDYVHSRQELIRAHENAGWLREQGVEVALGRAHFTAKNEIEVNGRRYQGKKIVIATGSRPRRLDLPGVEKVRYYDNESIFHLEKLPAKLLVIGGGPAGVEIAQALSRLGTKVTLVHRGERILPHDDPAVTSVLHQQLQNEGIELILKARPEHFSSSTEAMICMSDGSQKTLGFDAVFVAVGRDLNIEDLQLSQAGIETKKGKIVMDPYLRTTNKNVLVCGDVAGYLQFSHAAEFHGRILLNNFFSPFKKKLHNDHLSWVTFTDPEIATFGLSEQLLQQRKISYERVEQDFKGDDRAIIDHYPYGKLVLFLTRKRLLQKQKVLGGTMVAPHAGELIQELILANTAGLSINTLFHKIYPYPVAARANQSAIVHYKQKELTESLKKLLQRAYKLLS